MQDIQIDRRDLVLGGIVLGLWAVWTIARYQGHWPPDLSALYMAARFYGQGEFAEVYASPARFFGQDFPQSWVNAVAALGHPGEDTFPYIYPPLWAALFSPIATRVGPQAFFDGAYVVQIALLASMPWLAWRIVRPGLGFAAFALISAVLLETSVISAHALFHNQPQITVGFLVLLGFERLRTGHAVTAGLILGVAAAMKLSPLVLVVIFVAERQWRGAAAALAAFAALALLSLAVAGPELHRIFLTKLDLVGAVMIVWDLNISLRSAIFQISEVIAGRTYPDPSPTPLLLPLPGWIGTLCTAIFAAAGAAMLYLTRNAGNARLGHRLAAGFLLLTLCGPLSWTHHYLIALILLPGLFGALKPAAATVIILGYGVLFSNFLSPHLKTAFGPANVAPLLLVAAMCLLTLIFTLGARKSTPG